METQKKYEKYKKELKKNSVFSLIMCAISIAGIFAWVFLPVFSTGDGKFSMFNEAMLFVDALRSSESGPNYLMYSLLVEIFPIFVIIMGIITVIIQIKKLFGDIANLGEKSLAITYAQIVKTGEEKEKKSFFKQNTLFSFIIYFIFAIIYGKILGGLLRIPTYMSNLSGISAIIVIPVLLLVAFFAVSFVKNKAYKTLLYKILSEEDDNSNPAPVSQENAE